VHYDCNNITIIIIKVKPLGARGHDSLKRQIGRDNSVPSIKEDSLNNRAKDVASLMGVAKKILADQEATLSALNGFTIKKIGSTVLLVVYCGREFQISCYYWFHNKAAGS